MRLVLQKVGHLRLKLFLAEVCRTTAYLTVGLVVPYSLWFLVFAVKTKLTHIASVAYSSKYCIADLSKGQQPLVDIKLFLLRCIFDIWLRFSQRRVVPFLLTSWLGWHIFRFMSFLLRSAIFNSPVESPKGKGFFLLLCHMP